MLYHLLFFEWRPIHGDGPKSAIATERLSGYAVYIAPELYTFQTVIGL
jgi:hypothetical protein